MQNLQSFHTFAIPAHAQKILEITSIPQLKQVWDECQQENLPVLFLGQGSNVLFVEDFAGAVLINRLLGIQHEEDQYFHYLHVNGGEVWHDLVQWSIEQSIYGLENLALIPGCAGSAPIQNIGAYGCEVKDVIESVEAVNLATGEVETITGSDCGYSYRNSKFKHEWKNHYLITHVSYRLSKTFQPHLDYGNIRAALAENHILTPSAKELRQSIIAIREKKLPNPKVLGNAGSFFMNPLVEAHTFERLITRYSAMPFYKVGETLYKIPAGWLIEQCGWKGKYLGCAGVYEKQALVLVNLGGAKGTDIIALSDAIIHDVEKKFGISIHPEVNII